MSTAAARSTPPLKRRLATRILATFLGLLVAVQLVSFVLIRDSVEANSRARLRDALNLGEQVFLRLLRQRADHLVEPTRVLASDYGFRSAAAHDDRGTMAATLSNHRERLGANLSLFTDTHLHLKAGADGDATEMQAVLAALLKPGPNQDSPIDTHVIQVRGQPFQIVTVPVKAPLTVGWVVMGTQLNEHLLTEMHQLTGLDVAILTRSKTSPWKVALTDLTADQGRALARQWAAAVEARPQHGPTPATFKLPEGNFMGRIVKLESDPDEQAAAVLLSSVDVAVAPYERLQLGILAWSAFGLLIFTAVSLLSARRITKPIRMLTNLARNLANGDCTAPMPPQSDDEIGELTNAFEAMREAVHRRESEIHRQAFCDHLTQLPNRTQFNASLSACIEHLNEANGAADPASQQSCAVLMLDLDRFKHVNDVLGHETGDQLLRHVAKLLRELVPNTDDTVARLGGDEFAVLLRHGDLASAQALAQRILTTLEKPMVLNQQTVDLGTGIGIAIFPDHAQDAMTLKRRAEMALYKAKKAQTGTVVFEPELDVHSKEALSLLGELRQAIEHDQLRLYLQPKVSLSTGEVTGAEALVRWQHPMRGLVAPLHFIPFAEQTGFIRSITAWLIELSARTWRSWADCGLQLEMSINLSARDLIDPDLPAKLASALGRHRVPPRHMCLEITESAIMDDPQRALQTLEQLHNMGLLLAIDDFGTGYSSLAYLKRLPVDELKIDKSFVMNMQRDEQDAKIVRSTIDLAHNLGLKVIAEGLEDEQAWPLLKALSCDLAQGYWIAKPMPADEFVSWVAGWTRPAADNPFVPLDAAVV